jgi:hypothetical protein
MHKSQLAGIIIDCQTDEIDQAAAFWSAATGLTAITDPRSDISKYRRLETQPVSDFAWSIPSVPISIKQRIGRSRKVPLP